MMLYSNTKAKVHSPDRHKLLWHCCWKDTLASYQFITSQNYVLLISIDLIKENGFTLKKARSRWYSTPTITDADFVDDWVLLANTPTKAKSLLRSFELVARGIGHHMNEDKIEFMCLNQEGKMSPRNDVSLKLVDKFMYLSSNVSSAESDISIRLAMHGLLLIGYWSYGNPVE